MLSLKMGNGRLSNNIVHLFIVITLAISSCLVSLSQANHLPEQRKRRQLNQCNIFKGHWVRDNSYPMYDSSKCPDIRKEFDCLKYGRTNTNYLKYRWQPDDCDIPRFDGVDFLRRMRGKKIMFIGDSLSLNFYQSLICLLHAAVPNSKITHPSTGGMKSWFYQCYKVVDKHFEVKEIVISIDVSDITRMTGLNASGDAYEKVAYEKDTEEEQENFRRLLCYFLICFYVDAPSDDVGGLHHFADVADLENFEKILFLLRSHPTVVGCHRPHISEARNGGGAIGSRSISDGMDIKEAATVHLWQRSKGGYLKKISPVFENLEDTDIILKPYSNWVLQDELKEDRKFITRLGPLFCNNHVVQHKPHNVTNQLGAHQLHPILHRASFDIINHRIRVIDNRGCNEHDYFNSYKKEVAMWYKKECLEVEDDSTYDDVRPNRHRPPQHGTHRRNRRYRDLERRKSTRPSNEPERYGFN
uniref:Trichome birefringence-like N-terminal domain-containing protein n=1 Tax=Chenopodium quinoa TaxID=63459 RepID=A0A803MYE7_CHEQI